MTTLLEQYIYDAIREITTIVHGHEKMNALANDLLRAVEFLLEIKSPDGRGAGFVRGERDSLGSVSSVRSTSPPASLGMPKRDDYEKTLNCNPEDLTMEDKIERVRECLVITQRISAKQVEDRTYAPTFWGMVKHGTNYITDLAGYSHRSQFDAYLQLLFHTTGAGAGDAEVEHGLVIELQRMFGARQIAEIVLGEQTVEDEFVASMECYNALVRVHSDIPSSFSLFKKSFLAGGDLSGSKGALLQEARDNLKAIQLFVTKLREKIPELKGKSEGARYSEMFKAPEDKEVVRLLYQIIAAAYLTEDAIIQKKYRIGPKSLTEGLTKAFDAIDNMKDRLEPPNHREGSVFLDITAALIKTRCEQFQKTHGITSVGQQSLEGWVQERISSISAPAQVGELLSKLSYGVRLGDHDAEGEVLSLSAVKPTSQDGLRHNILVRDLKRGIDMRAVGGTAIEEHEKFKKFQKYLMEEVGDYYEMFKQYDLLDLQPTDPQVNPRVALQMAFVDYKVTSSRYPKYGFSEPLPLVGLDISGLRQGIKCVKASEDKSKMTEEGLCLVGSLLDRCLAPETQPEELELLVESLQVLALKATLYSNAKLCTEARSGLGNLDIALRNGLKRMDARQKELHPEILPQRRLVK
jgi:hypothetical protein